MNAPRPLPNPLSSWHAWARRQPWLRRFTLANRLLLAVAFLPTGLVKLLGRRFTVLSVDNPIGFFFEAMYQTGPYWHFVGTVQVVAAVLLLIPATATLGALLFLPVGVSVFLITLGLGFQGTVWITSGMLLSVTYLICWDGDRIWAAGAQLVGRRGGSLVEGMHRLELAGWTLGGGVGMAFFLMTRGFVPGDWMPILLGAGVATAVMVVLGWVLGARRGLPSRE